MVTLVPQIVARLKRLSWLDPRNPRAYGQCFALVAGKATVLLVG